MNDLKKFKIYAYIIMMILVWEWVYNNIALQQYNAVNNKS